MKTTFELRSGKISFTIEEYTAEEIRLLSDEKLKALVDSGIQNWGYRAGARKANDGKVFSIEEIATAIEESGGPREGKPTEADEKKAAEIHKAIASFAGKEYPLTVSPKDKDAYSAEHKSLQPKWDAYCWTRVLSKVATNASAQGYEFREPNKDENILQYLAEWLRFHRLHVARKIKKAGDLQ